MKFLIIVLITVATTYHAYSLNAVVYNGTGQSAENKLVAMTIAGIVNRDAPRLYLRNVYETWSYSETDETWENLYKTTGNVNFTVISDINQLVQTFSSFLKGAITYDSSLTYGNFTGQSFRWQGEAAALLGGFTDCIPVPVGNTYITINKPATIDLPDHFNNQPSMLVSAQLASSTHPWNNTTLTAEQRYFAWLDWAMDNLLPRSNPAKFYLREITDWAIHQRMFQLNLAGTEDLRFTSLTDEKAAKIERVMNYLRLKKPGEIFHVYGWMRPEPLTQWISAYGGSFHETLLSNLSWHHVFPVDANFSYTRASDDASNYSLQNKHYVLFLASEGDAGNWVVGFQGGAWQSASRGQVPMGWGVNLQMFEEFPFIAQHYYRTASANDGFIAVATPLGYAYPDVFPSSYLPDAKTKTIELMQKFKMQSVYAYKHYNGAGKSTYRGIEISNNFNFSNLGAFASQTDAQLTLLYDPALQTQRAYTGYGGLLYNHVNDETFYANVSNLTTARDRIAAKLTGKAKPGFLLAGYQRFRHDQANLSSTAHDITVPRLKTLMDDIKNNTSVGADVEFVTPEKFTWLLRKSMGLPTSVQQAVQNNQQLLAIADQNGSIQLNLQLPTAQTLEIIIFTITGQKVHTERWDMIAGNDFKTIKIQEKGIFLITVAGKNVKLTTKVILQE
jgi:hypothetical protein